jgi:hypothetical protein
MGWFCLAISGCLNIIACQCDILGVHTESLGDSAIGLRNNSNLSREKTIVRYFQRPHLFAIDLVRGVGGAPHELKGSLEVFVAQLHLTPLAPHRRQVLHVLEGHLHQAE